MKSEGYRRKMDTWDELLDRKMDVITRLKEQHAMFSYELQSAFMFRAEFSKIYYKLTNLSLEQ
jgi:hypothetical protein